MDRRLIPPRLDREIDFIRLVMQTLKGRWTMSLNFNRPVTPAGTFARFALALTFLLFSALLLAQTTVGSGSIQGTVTDPSSAVVSGAKVVITNQGTSQTQTLTSN